MKFSPPFTLALLCSAAGLPVLAGCSATALSDMPEASGLNSASGTLSVRGDATVALLPGESGALSVRFTPDDAEEALAGVPVEFAVIAPESDESGTKPAAQVPPGASLEPPVPLTNEEGIAETALTVGSTAGKFRVRASAEGAEPVFFDVIVRSALAPQLSVSVTYDGSRDLALRSATLVPSMSCEQALAANMVGSEVRTVDDPNKPLVFELGAGLAYAVIAWGRDSENAGLARGCAEFTAPVTADDAKAAVELEVPLVDLPMRLMGIYKLALTLDVSESMERLAAFTRAQAEVALGGADAQAGAEAYLDAVEAVLRTRGALTEADTFAQRRLAATLTASGLADVLSQADSGLLAAADALGAFWARAGSQLSLSATYGVGAPGKVPMTLSLDGLVARSADGLSAYDLLGLTGYMPPTASVLADYDDAKAVVDVTALGVALSLDSYGRSLLDACLKAEPDWVLSRLGAAAGCTAVGSWLSAQSNVSDLCDAGCVAEVCPTALNSLVNSVRDAFPLLGEAHAAINLRGEMAAHDRDGDGVVNDLGPARDSLEGNWGQAQSEAEEDAVTAVLGTPPSESALAQ